MSAAAEATPDWKQWEGEIVASDFRLERLLGATENSAVFSTRFHSGPAAIKLVPAADPARLVEAWDAAAALNHTNLTRILKSGTFARAGISIAYVVMELADENLATVLAERALTADETTEMLQPVADALAYLHSQGFVHGRLKPSNIFAVDETLKISADSLAAGAGPEDIVAVAALLSSALTPRGDASQDLPAPFDEIARGCLGSDGLRWSAEELAGRLRSHGTPTAALPSSEPPAKPRGMTFYALVLSVAALVIGIVGTLLRNRPPGPPVVSQSQASTPKPAEPAASAPPVAPATAPPKVDLPAKEERRDPPARPAPSRGTVVDPEGRVVHEVLPDILPKARRTIHGKATVSVAVSVDPTGNVTSATLEPGGSAYFGKLARAAAQHWRFTAGSEAQEWILRFEITPTETKAFLQRPPPR